MSICLHVRVLHIHVFPMHAWHLGSSEGSDGDPRAELQVPVSHHVVMETEPGSSAKAASVLNLRHLSSPSDINSNLPRPST